MTTTYPIAAAMAAAVLACAAASAATPPVPETPKRPVTDVIHGETIVDDYRWLEQTDNAEVKAWIAEQNALTRSVLDAQPRRAPIKAELLGMLGEGRVSRQSLAYAGGQVFALKQAPPLNQSLLVRLAPTADPATERVILDPNRLDPSGKLTIDWYQPSLDGRRVAVSLSSKGSEDGTLHVYETATGRALPDVVPRVQYPTGGGSVAWAADGKGFFYTRYPQGDERPKEDANFYQQVWFHRLGTPAARDEYVIGKDFPRIAEIRLTTSEDGRHVLADVSNGDGGEHGFFLRGPGGAWRQIAGFSEGFRTATFGRDGRLYALSLNGSPRGRIVALRLDAPAAGLSEAAVVVPESEAVIESVEPTASRLYVNAMVGGPSELRVFKLDGTPLPALSAEPIAAVRVGTRLAKDAILFGSESFVSAFAWFLHDPRTSPARPRKTALSDPPAYAVDGGLPGTEAVREFAISKDGTRVPVSIVRRQGTRLDGSNPVLLTGYGGYGLSIRPRFSRFSAVWLRHRGVFAQANLRGGGEFGEEWHLAGNLTKKQNVFDDFIAAARLMIERGYTRPERLAIQGGSNGGLLMGAVTVQEPALFRAVVSRVGLYDMLRVELTPNGAFNVTEFGTVKDAAQFKALYAYSPLHGVKDGTAYPAVLLTTGEHDGRVAPWMSYKMAARLQAATASGQSVLLRVASDAGHGIGTSLASAVDEDADALAFLFGQLGME